MKFTVARAFILCLAVAGSQALFLSNNEDGERANVTCAECHVLVGALETAVKAGAPLEELEVLAVDVCVTGHLFSEDVCWDMVYLAAPEVIYILNNTQHDLNTVCYILLHTCDPHMEEWSVVVPPNKPDSTLPDPVPEGTTKYRILHLSDTHYEPFYEEGTPTICDHPLCCRPYGDPVEPDTPLAGPYGAESGDCDPPLRTLEAALQASADLQPDIIYMTGDIPPHDVWAQSHDSIVASINDTASIIRSYFPDTPIAYALGNHEAAPVNSYAVPLVYSDGWSMDWLYSDLEAVWAEAGVPSEAMATIRRGGYYHWSPTPGLRVVALNTNYGSHENWFLLMDIVDPTGQLLWLSGVLEDAEEAGEKVHILGHVAPGGLLGSFSHSINQLISRFESTVTGIFVGHSHSDHFHVQWDVEDNTRPVAVTYVAPSISSNGKKSPSFRLYEVDGGHENATWALLDHFTYSLNLTLANAGEAPSFPMAYSAREAYNLSSLSPASWADAAWKMATDDELFNEYLRHLYSFLADPEQLATCDDNCRRSELCDMYSGDESDDEPCQRIMDQVPDLSATTEAFENTVGGFWVL